jgi:prepilin-type N-terminal cleavage/methylation domain-containing protein
MKLCLNHRIARDDRATGGFSLVELLVVISVIAIIAALSLPFISGILGDGGEIQNQRNAQTIASVAAAAQAAGNVTIGAAADLDAAINLIQSNTVVGMGAFVDMKFSISTIAAEDVTQAKAYLTFADGMIHYDP